jgi:DNA-binding response OmpR family regulator
LKKGFQAESFSVDAAMDGERGSLLARTESFDAIVLDVTLPKKNGIEVLKELREAKVSTPVLTLTVRSELEDRVQG